MSKVQIPDSPTIVCHGRQVTLQRKIWTMPTVCPCCGSSVQIVTNADGSTAKSRICPNKEKCSDQVYARLEHAVKKASLDIDGCGESTIRALMAHGVTNLLGLFTIEDVAFLGNAASKRFNKSRATAKTAPLWRKIHAFGIEGIGVTFAKELSSKWPVLADMMDASEEELATIVGPVAASNLRAYFMENIDIIVALIEIGVTFEDSVKTGPLTGQTFCITGTLVSGSREEVSERIENAGGKMKSSVGRDLGYLVIGEAPGRNKTEAADKYGVKKINEEALYALMGMQVPMPSVQVNTEEFAS